MAKTIKRSFSILFGLLATLLAGLFFVGCDVDSSKITLTASESVVELEVGDTTDIYFDLKNYEKGFSNKISVSERSTSGTNVGDQASIFECSDVTYLSETRMRVTITAKNGGEGILYAKTYEGGKECSVNVKVTQYTTTMSATNNTLIVTNGVNFTPDSSLFSFDSNTTYKKLSHYYFTPKIDFNFKTYYINQINETTGVVTFTDGIGGSAEGDINRFDFAYLSDENKIVLSNGGETTEKDFVDTFYMLSVYDYSVGNDSYERILFAISAVHVLPSLDINVSGGYLIDDSVSFSPLVGGEDIIIVPNNEKMSTYIIKLEVANSISSSPIDIKKIVDGANYLDIDILSDFDDGSSTENKVYYWKVSQNTQSQNETSFGFRVFYDVAQDIEIDSVNCEIDFVGTVEIAPTAITVNGSTDPSALNLYNYYDDRSSASIGWEELYIGVISGYSISPSFEGIYFEYDNSLFDFTYEGVKVENGSSRLYTDLTKPFHIKGKKGVDQTNSKITIHLKSDILQGVDELTLDLGCNIVSGAQNIEIVNDYIGYDYFYLDVNGGEQDFSGIAYTDKQFQSLSSKFDSLNDVVEIVLDKDEPYIKDGGNYYLNIKVRPLAVGDGEYSIFLDNGVRRKFKFRVKRTLQPETTSIKLADEGNGNVTSATYSRYDEYSEFDDVLNIELLNASDANKIVYGSIANVIINAYAEEGIDAVSSSDAVLVAQTSVANGGISTNYRLTTQRNGDAEVTFSLNGIDINNFAYMTKEETIRLNISSYSLANEFIVRNGDSYANDNIVYFGENAGVDDRNLTFNISAHHADSTNFFKYALKEETLKAIYNDGIDISDDAGAAYTILNENVDEPELIHETYSDKFVYYYAQRQAGRALDVYTEVTVMKDNDESLVKTVKLRFSNGLMFMGETMTYVEYNTYGEEEAQYTITFSNVYSIGANYGKFNLSTMTYTVSDNAETTAILVISANLRQRNSTKKYNITIRPTAYTPVTNISLATTLTKINFTNSELEYTFGVYTYPTNSTNKKISIEFVRTNVNPNAADKYYDLVSYSVDTTNSENGVFMITISCRDFYNKHISDIATITDALTGMLYIYPREWGGSYTGISKYSPISLEIQYRNGSKANPYLLESAEDVVEIGANEVMLQSNYEISSVVDMSSIETLAPIGIVDGEMVGFSGSIIGSSSQAAITNINISDDNLSAVIGGQLYAGLFAKINESATIENVLFSGKIDIDNVDKNANIGLLAGENEGKLINSGARLGASEINVTANVGVNFGGLVGSNSGAVYQYLKKYSGEETTGQDFSGYRFKKLSGIVNVNDDGTYYVYVDGEKVQTDAQGYMVDGFGKRLVVDEDDTILPSAWNYTGQTSKNMAFFNGFMNISLANNASLNAGGVAGYNTGTLGKYSASLTYKMYGYASYSAFTLIKVRGTALVANKNVNVGGVVGDIETEGNASIKNLVVGGEVDTTETNNYVDNVGGLLGYTTVGKIDILANVSRVFVRGNEHVGGIAGFEDAGNAGNEYITWGNANTIEAIDDGRSAYNAALIIKNKAKEEGDVYYDATYFTVAIGYTARVYNSTTSFGTYTYLQRSVVSNVDKNSVSTDIYYGDYICVGDPDFETHVFTAKNATVELSGSNRLQEQNGEMQDMFFMYYFGVSGVLVGDEAQSSVELQDKVKDLNIVSPTSVWYPFDISSSDVTIATQDGSILSVDSNGFMTINNVGFVTLSISSLLNINVTQKVYLYVVNFFNADVDTSIYYVSPSSTSLMVVNGSTLNIYGNSSTSVYVVPNYESGSQMTINGDSYSVNSTGVLRYANMNLILSKNPFVTTEAVLVLDDGETEEERTSKVQINKQTVVFSKNNDGSHEIEDGDEDSYVLVPKLQVTATFDGVRYVYFYELEGAKTSLKVSYHDTATAINVRYRQNAVMTNNPFSDYVIVNSTSAEEKLFYQIWRRYDDGTEELVQDKLPVSSADIANFYTGDENDKMNITNEDLFNFVITKRSGELNTFDYTCIINTESNAFKNRFNKSIYGDYIIWLYANELENGVTNYIKVRLDEASVNYVSATNYSNIKNVAQSDVIIVPAQNGLIEVSIDPIEAIFDTFTISNNAINLRAGAGQASFTFVYEKEGVEGVTYEYAPSFAVAGAESLSFTYQEMMNFFVELAENGTNVSYKGKVYIGYIMAANNVEDGVSVAFDVRVTYGDNEYSEASVGLVTKLSSYAKLSFNNRSDVDGSYLVARGLSYDLTLDYYGFAESQVTITSTDASVAVVYGANGKYTLKVTDGVINYDRDEMGYAVNIVTVASKTVDGVSISTSQTISLYVMEYVLNYEYVDGVIEDIVSGMRNGVIEDSIGNPYDLKMDLTKFVEYDKSIGAVVNEVEFFLSGLLDCVEFKVYYNDTETTLAPNFSFREEYYAISGYTVTPLKIYNASSNIYHFSVEANYTVSAGTFKGDLTGQYLIYSEFAFEVHDQSTENTPIPVSTYDELMSMSDDEWYILTKDIVIPSDEVVAASGVTAFAPISARISGLDGNGYRIMFSGNYTFEGTNVGLFSSVETDMVIKNVTIAIATDTVFNLSVETFNVGLIAASNDGVITNCEVKSISGAKLSVLSSVDTSSSYVGGIAATNSGFITHSRVAANIRTNVNLAGLVGQNSGLISSSYFKGASLENMTGAVSEYVAGVAVTNSGRIYASYVSGDATTCAGKPYYDGTDNSLASNNNMAGFVYTNTGDIVDCYSNIRINSGAYAAGFVFENSSVVERCFSTSVLASKQTSNYGFAYRNVIGGSIGTMNDCFYIEDTDINDSIGKMVTDADVNALKISEFADLSRFENFIYSSDRSVSSVWFYSESNENDGLFTGLTFNTGRLELVAPNIIATSIRDLDRIENVVDPDTGASYAQYIYVYRNGMPSSGSMYNPIVISDCETFEQYILNETNSAGFNNAYYRLVCDINYADSGETSELYNVKFTGYLEGNYITISDISLISDDDVENAGLFGQIGSSTSGTAIGTMMNFTLKPKIISYSSASCVGTLAGRIEDSTLINISIVRENDQKVAVGNNIVGGAIGCAVGDYKIINVVSQIGAKARRQNVSTTLEPNEFNESSTDFKSYSFAGSFAGVLSGTGYVENVVIDDVSVSVLADKAGLLFGFVDSNVTVKNIDVNVDSSMIVNAYTYGGLVAGELKGTFVNVNVSGNGDFANFKKVPFVPTAVGGIVGFLNRGTIDTATMTQNIVVASGSDDKGIEHLGGIAGIASAGSRIYNTDVGTNSTASTLKLQGFAYVGGFVGSVLSNENEEGVFELQNAHAYVSLYVSGRGIENIGAGGLIGQVLSGVTLKISSAEVVVGTLSMTTYIYSNVVSVYVGAVIGKAQAERYNISDVASTMTGEANEVNILDMTKSETDSKTITQAETSGESLYFDRNKITTTNTTTEFRIKYTYSFYSVDDGNGGQIVYKYNFVVTVCGNES
ncbi:MAG: hypothetical protein IJ817_03900 [Clostridia bacterium]|nr:hypothetical protein [Clostridia bacterium]